MVDLGFEAISHFHSVNRARITRVSPYSKVDRARARVIINLKNVRQFVKLF